MLTNHLKFICTLCGLVLSASALAQTAAQSSVESFHKIVVGPHIVLELRQGNEETVSLEYRGVQEEDIHVDVDGKTLRIYLDGAKMIPKDSRSAHNSKWSRYADAHVHAVVEYTDLRKLKVRGDQRVICHSPLTGSRFKLRLFGENDVTLTAVNTDVFVASLFGDNELAIDEGYVNKGKYKFFGDNQVYANGLESSYSKAKSFGESEFRLHVDDLLRVSSFGESTFRFTGNADVSRGFMFGENQVYRR